MRVQSWHIGLFIWLLILIVQPSGLFYEWWARLLLLLAALVWIPLAFSLPILKNENFLLQIGMLPSAILLVVSMLLPKNYWAFICAIPWFLITFLIFINGLKDLFQIKKWTASIIAINLGQVFLIIGGAWLLADRFDFQPVSFSPDIVLLTSIHFHYAGFIFPLLAGLAAQKQNSEALNLGSTLAIIAIPMTAIGITISHLHSIYHFELIAAVAVVIAGWCVAIGYFEIIVKNKLPLITRMLWFIMSITLLISMTLAFLYAIRFYYVIDWLSIPAMRAFHGTLNAIVVSGCGLLGWRFYKNEF
ncbi:MAG: YndJ family transporter [Saprospiraceae bacterium]|nr:YndJ family transporter [Saprospiraceae bacterium]